VTGTPNKSSLDINNLKIKIRNQAKRHHAISLNVPITDRSIGQEMKIIGPFGAIRRVEYKVARAYRLIRVDSFSDLMSNIVGSSFKSHIPIVA
jgi:hypothetical protein